MKKSQLLGLVASIASFPLSAYAQVTANPQGSAVMAVATVGLMMLTGRMNWRFGATVILGCFILFGAGAIVSGIRSAAALG
jgi:type IV secretory pathway VirB2 component (pilin)